MRFPTSSVFGLFLLSSQVQADCVTYDAFPPNGADLRTALSQYYSGTWTGNLNGFNYGPDIENWCTKSVTNMDSLFRNYYTFNPDISKWDTSSVIYMQQMFQDARSFNQNLTDWNTSSVVNMRSMFQDARAFNGDVSNWDLSSVSGHNMVAMFANSRAFNQDLDKWDVSGVTDFTYVFSGAKVFNGNVSTWDTTAAKTMKDMFYYAEAFNQDLNQWDVSGVTTFYQMFWNAFSFNGTISNWDITGITEDCGLCRMFEQARAFNQPLPWDTSGVTNFYHLFFGAFSFNQPLPWDTSSVRSFQEMFYHARAFDQDLSSWDTSSNMNLQGTFNNAHAFNGNVSTWDTSNVVNMNGVFRSAEKFDGDLSQWNTASVRTMYAMFAFASDFTGKGLGNWDVNSVTSMSGMLRGTSFAGDGGGIAKWDVSKVVDFGYMFRDLDFFTGGDVVGWNIASAANMGGMFENGKMFNQNLCGWRDSFPYSKSANIFRGANCTLKDQQPQQDEKAPFCASDCTTTLEPTNAPTESPTANPTPAIPSWIVQHKSTIANFNATNGEEEITLVYTIGKNRVAVPTLYKEDCETPLDVDENSDSFDGISFGRNVTSDLESDPYNSKYEVFLNVEKNANVLDDLLSNGNLLSFCSKVALLGGSDGTTEIKKNETNIAITLNFTNTFSVDDISLKQIYVGQDNVTTNVLEYVEACACADGKSDDGRKCITNPPAIAVDDTVKVCVSSTSPEMEIASLDRLYLQGSGDEVLTIVQDGDWENGMASVVSYAAEVWNGVFAEGVVPSSYYSYQGDVPVTVTGTVILKLAGSRRRIAVELGHKDKSESEEVVGVGTTIGAARGSSRALQSAEDQQTSAFAVNFALQKSELELSDADVNGATGASVSGFGFVAAATGIISSVIAAIMIW